ncbi:hypothetical protein GPECTOR_22g788 [Gonium pectorale]|uniref:Cupin type-1 domain-containing protein n=1 Tax=Gonium pectorale TaxID=33097 RepID=A0A150GH79_GONPE|nr:hypothetical protein GPECTOR_22g788 [Gonium pectorale]|eukprot:KXZ49198.1 hypothetical protein GPECTOR_22g788 [Gonium pectorale]
MYRHNSTGASTHPNNSASSSSSTSQLLDVLYVLAGTGVVTSADGTVRRLHAGDSLIAWHNATEMHCASAADEPPVALKFHFPASVLMPPPGAVPSPAPSHAELQILVDEMEVGGNADGELSAQEADDMLRGVQQRASRAISSLYDGADGGDAAASGDVRVAANGGVAAALGHRAESGAAAAPAPSAPQAGSTRAPAAAVAGNVVPFLRRMVGGAAAPAAGGLRWLRNSLAAQLAGRGHAGASTSVPSLSGHSGASPSESSGPGCVLLQRAMEDFKAFRFPRQTNKLAFVFDPSELGLSLSFGVEVFEPGHHTPLHIHRTAHELFFVLAGEGVAVCNGQRFTVRAGDCVVFPPRAVHGIDNDTGHKLYCLQLMTPNEAFVEHVKSGEPVGRLDDEDICNLIARHC